MPAYETPAFETIDLEVRDGVAHLTLNRPDAANGINLALARDLLAATLAIAADPGARVVLLDGAGKLFCGGGDLKGFAGRDDLPAHLREILAALHSAITNLVRGDAPVVAAVQGSAAGAGMGFVGAADLVVAAESAKFVMAYTGVGLTPDGSSSWFLPRLVGLRRAIELTFTNRVLSAAEALEWGLITQVVPDAELHDTASAVAATLATGPQQALAAAKRLLHTSLEDTLETHLAREAESISAASGTAEGIEGVAAFVEKRKPVFNP
jgi:2-(1,2-epoxy-1,2-dihydrophenyl)acetyl-CoA isomerase